VTRKKPEDSLLFWQVKPGMSGGVMAFQHPCLSLLISLSTQARAIVARSLRELSVAELSRTTGYAGSDVIYAIDREVEEGLVAMLEAEAGALGGIVLVAEGIGENEISSYPQGRADAVCAWRLLVDPIDGTRGIMMDKRSAWFLAGVAANKGPGTRLRDIDCSIMAELPTSRAAVADTFTAVRGEGVQAVRSSMVGEADPVEVSVTPFAGGSIRGGFAQFAKFFPPGREHMAAIEEEMIRRLFPDAEPGEILCFEDQYISTGGQLVELITGRDRFTADLRATLYQSKPFAGQRIGHVCHPYDLAGWLVAEEAGIQLTNPDGTPLDGPFETTVPADWIGYANAAVRHEVEPTLLALLKERSWV
jgi:hypothetical protein